MLVLLILIEENVKGIISLHSLACEIFLLLYLFSSSRVFFFILRLKVRVKNHAGIKKNSFTVGKPQFDSQNTLQLQVSQYVIFSNSKVYIPNLLFLLY